MKKRLNIDMVQNDLRGGSAFFPGYKGGSSNTQIKTPPTPPRGESYTEERQKILAPQPTQPVLERSNDTTPVRPNGRRIITRNSFETYEGQMESLRKLSYQQKMDG